MSRTPRYHELIETSWRRKLSPAEESELRALTAVDAEMRADWDAEAALNQGLSTLPEVPVPSNFTARVMQAINAEEARDRRQRQPILSRLGPVAAPGPEGGVCLGRAGSRAVVLP